MSKRICVVFTLKGIVSVTFTRAHYIAVRLLQDSVRELPRLLPLNGPIPCPDVVQCAEHKAVLIERKVEVRV